MSIKGFGKESPVRFVLTFLSLFVVFYYFNLLYFGVTAPGNHYIPFLADHLDYIRGLRYLLLHISAQIINWLGYTAITNDTELLVAGHTSILLIYSCLGLGVISFFTAFVLAYPKKLKAKLFFIAGGILAIEVLNVIRFVLLGLFWSRQKAEIVNHHTIFNILIYLIIGISLYFWVKHDDKKRIHATD